MSSATPPFKRAKLEEALVDHSNKKEDNAAPKIEGVQTDERKPKNLAGATVSHYYVLGDVVWVRPARLPYWPAEVVEVISGSLFRCRLFSPPTPMPAQPAFKVQGEKKKEKEKEQNSNGDGEDDKDEVGEAGPKENNNVDEIKREEAASTNKIETQPGDVIVEAAGTKLYFFDRLRSQFEIDASTEERLQKKKHNVSTYEASFHKAVEEANSLVRIVLNPDVLVKNPNPPLLEQQRQFENFLPPAAVVAMPIGVVHSFFRTHTDAPRQPHVPGVVPKAGVIIVRTGLENALKDLKGFEWCWVVFHFSYSAGPGQQLVELGLSGEEDGGGEGAAALDAGQKTTRDGAPVSNTKKPKTQVVPPRDTKSRGVFATRSPHRPNGIGLSCCRLIDVRRREVHIGDHDLLHGTPILDIKPYLPFCDSHPGAKAGWVDALDASGKSLGDHRRSGDFVVHRAHPPTAGGGGK